ncbi:DNA/RNA helicase [Veronia nyctiphanis]|uniref:DNA/RNA helicase n=1 Tax=Veronia nyctiphanis TaxID=1278244 RepID=A0A4Q0YNL1_9GAMM|nr:AAA family ATPase [Veronia nyctiphanis]RXJ72038.1 DNA/RNA helicase [Veronia nyctiphanis]RXJ72053.1 DNA/RNA helicase [Veronia nyctiphanis]
MQLPNTRQLSDEQLDIFEEAPEDGCILVSGAPGTGKTVIAFLRAGALARRKKKVTVLMYNRVLKRFTENVAANLGDSVTTSTMHSWMYKWWSNHRIVGKGGHGSRLLLEGDRAYVHCSYGEHKELKKLGGRWDPKMYNPNSRKLGMWYVPRENYEDCPADYLKWTGKNYKPPELEKWRYDWMSMRDSYIELEGSERVDWGHLIIDEAQDFEPDMFRFLKAARSEMENGGITILADENQRIHVDSNSSLDDIRKALRISSGREFSLTENYRNTRQIALVARHFYVGLSTGVPNLPVREGNRPVFVSSPSYEAQVDYIASYLDVRGGLEVGIVVDSLQDIAFFGEELKKRLSGYTVQLYSSNNSKDSENLIFDTQGVVTILHRQSCKGLEFDAVFVPNLQKFSVDDTDETTFKMNMYVICSRARSELFFLCKESPGIRPGCFDYLPAQGSNLIEYREHN